MYDTISDCIALQNTCRLGCVPDFIPLPEIYTYTYTTFRLHIDYSYTTVTLHCNLRLWCTYMHTPTPKHTYTHTALQYPPSGYSHYTRTTLELRSDYTTVSAFGFVQSMFFITATSCVPKGCILLYAWLVVHFSVFLLVVCCCLIVFFTGVTQSNFLAEKCISSLVFVNVDPN